MESTLAESTTMTENNHEGTVTKEDYVDASGAIRCVDERADKEGELLGVQMPGGAEHLMDLLLVSISKSGGEVSEEALFAMVDTVLKSETAVTFGIKPGVHIDDEHGHLDMETCANRDFGCGYDKVRADVIKSLDVTHEYNPGDRIKKARALGWNIQVLTGDHVATATAAINTIEGKTLKTQELLADGRKQSFNYDLWAVTALKGELIAVLEEEYPQAAKVLEANTEKWGRELYVETLNILSGGALGENSLIGIS